MKKYRIRISTIIIMIVSVPCNFQNAKQANSHGWVKVSEAWPIPGSSDYVIIQSKRDAAMYWRHIARFTTPVSKLVRWDTSSDMLPANKVESNNFDVRIHMDVRISLSERRSWSKSFSHTRLVGCHRNCQCWQQLRLFPRHRRKCDKASFIQVRNNFAVKVTLQNVKIHDIATFTSI